ncbi:mitochondrial ATP synthase g subunit-domain-containing protein [Irpex lacteus]|nr:mitochondrial ATP synthase g subunit-domain-containing protein [Irpex lacteus]
MVRPTIRLSQSLRPRRAPQSHPRQVRFASTNPSTEAAQKKAQDALASAQKYAGQAAETAQKFLGPVGERAAGFLGAYRQPIVYNYQVAREFLKQIYIAERLQPPSLSTVQSVYKSLWANATSPAYIRELVSSGAYLKVGVYAVEAYGIFKIGEIIGRRNLVGYKLE